MIPSRDDCNLALIAHLSGCAGVITGGLLGFLGPLIIYLLNKDSSFVASQAKEALNFQITLFVFSMVAVVVTFASCGSLFPLVFVPVVLQFVFGVIAAFAVRKGQPYAYPFTFRLVQ